MMTAVATPQSVPAVAVDGRGAPSPGSPAVAAESVRAVHAALATRFAAKACGGSAVPRPAGELARDLIAAMLDVPRFWPITHRDTVLDADVVAQVLDAAERLERGMPFAYAVRRAAFRGLSLYVDEQVLIPRPETELLVDIVLDEMRRTPAHAWGTAIDVGTGSGCLALALASEGKFARVIATDLSADALAVARHNARAALPPERQAQVEFREGSFLAPCAADGSLGRVTVVVSNPPYIAWHEHGALPRSVRDWEPPLALCADDDGMDAIAEVARGALGVLVPGGLLAMEVDARRAGRAADVVTAARNLAGDGARFGDVVVRPDLTGRARFVVARRGRL